MDVGTGIAVGIPAGAGVLGIIAKLIPRNSYVRESVCAERVKRIEQHLDRLDEEMGNMEQRLHDDIGALREAL